MWATSSVIVVTPTICQRTNFVEQAYISYALIGLCYIRLGETAIFQAPDPVDLRVTDVLIGSGTADHYDLCGLSELRASLY